MATSLLKEDNCNYYLLSSTSSMEANIRLSVLYGYIQTVQTILVQCGHICSILHKDLHYLHVALPASQMKRCHLKRRLQLEHETGSPSKSLTLLGLSVVHTSA